MPKTSKKGVKKPIKTVLYEIFLSQLDEVKIAEIDDIHENPKIFKPYPSIRIYIITYKIIHYIQIQIV